MARLTKTDILECGAVADKLVAELCAKGATVDLMSNFAEGLFSDPRFVKTSVRLGKTFKPFALTDVTANSNICVEIPTQGARPATFTAVAANLKRVIWGVVAHELTHVAQQGQDPTAFQAALVLKARFDQSPRSPDDYFDLYIDEPLEQEARAIQGAAEVLSTGTACPDRAAFVAALALTEITKRTDAAIGPSQAPERVRWWREYADQAWDAYQAFIL